METKLELERDYRRQVRRAYYKREEDFASLKEYNDYLEEVEDIVEGLLNEATRKDTRERLEKLAASAAAAPDPPRAPRPSMAVPAAASKATAAAAKAAAVAAAAACAAAAAVAPPSALAGGAPPRTFPLQPKAGEDGTVDEGRCSLVQPCRGETRIDGKLYLQSRAPLLVSLRGALASAGTRVKLCCLDSSERLLAPQWRVLQLVLNGLQPV